MIENYRARFQESLTQQAVSVKDRLLRAQQLAQPFIEASQKINEKLQEVQRKREKMSKRLGDAGFGTEMCL